jgi:hypothetical protein
MGHHVVILELAQTGVPIPPLRLEAALDALPAFASVGAIPPANPADRKVVRVGTPESYRLYAWLPRPAPGHPGKLRVKAIDPLGRIGTASAALPDVP